MIPELGNFALALACAIAFAQTVLPLWGGYRRDARLIAAAPALALGQLLALCVAAAALVWSAVVSDFTVLNVVQNSASNKPLLYKITGTWGDHEGSMLLWAFILGCCGGAVAAFGGRLPSAFRARVIGVLGAVSCGFLLFAVTASNPFLRVWPPPMQGQGMNPLLQDPGLAFHPPLLYAGYVGFAVPFAFAVAALLEGRVDAAWARWVRPWALASWCFLTCGIALGSWWAYYELGWGGFWFWDPVENASLMPWLTGTALLHCAIVVEKREALKVWTVLLAIATFSLSLSGTFLVRSGILNSVHSFATDPTRGLFILVLLGITICGSLLLFAVRAPTLVQGGLFAPLSREGALVLNNVLLCSICAVVITGTVYPLIVNLLFGVQLSVGKPFFDMTVIPLSIPLFAMMSVGPMLAWKRAALGPALIRLWWAAVGAAVVGLLVALRWRALPALAFAGSSWLVLGGVATIVERIRLFRLPLSDSLARLGAVPRGTWGAAVAHAGLGITIAGIAGMSFATHSIALLHPGQSVRETNYTWTLQSLSNLQGPDFSAKQATLQVSRDGHAVATLKPERRFFPIQRITTIDTAIHTNGLVDLYAVLGDERDGGAVIRVHHNPLAPWIWLGALVMAIGGGLSLSDRRLRVGAPARRRVPVPA